MCLQAFDTIARLEYEPAWFKRRMFGRKAFPAHLPRIEEVVEPKDEERVRASRGKAKTKIGEDVRGVLKHMPQSCS